MRADCREGCDLGNFNTFLGDDARGESTSGFFNTAVGVDALFRNTANNNTAIGALTLAGNTSGFANTATGETALFVNTTGNANTANGAGALNRNTTGSNNTAIGQGALFNNTTGDGNTALGTSTLADNTIGNFNTAIGFNALLQGTGEGNIAIGNLAGQKLTTGDHNIYIDSFGKAIESNTIRIGRTQSQTNTYIAGVTGATVAEGVGVIIDTHGHLGTVLSSERYKDAIKPMDKASEAVLALKPVTFRYKKQLDPKGIPQFGLVAEEVEKVNPHLVARDKDGKPYTVRYEAVNAMLLNEFLKEHRKNEEQQSKIEQQEVKIARQQKHLSPRKIAMIRPWSRFSAISPANIRRACTGAAHVTT